MNLELIWLIHLLPLFCKRFAKTKKPLVKYELNYNITKQTYFICIKHTLLNEECSLLYTQIKDTISHLTFLLTQLNISMDERKIEVRVN